jgi:3-hydroxyacyl-CoA dehydrogenase/enoyl-CoA hydratase/3-hydroxybutyryl-CoA epimerase
MHESAVYVVEKMAHGFKRLGRAAGAGFYDYGSEPASLWSGLKTFERRARQLPVEDIRDRLVTAATLAALDTPPSAEDAALTSVLGPSVPVNRNDAAQLLSGTAGAAFASRARELAARFGARFEPPAESHSHAS